MTTYAFTTKTAVSYSHVLEFKGIHASDVVKVTECIRQIVFNAKCFVIVLLQYFSAIYIYSRVLYCFLLYKL